jgi:hypothetical protein
MKVGQTLWRAGFALAFLFLGVAACLAGIDILVSIGV